jgi:hypothetical protein
LSNGTKWKTAKMVAENKIKNRGGRKYTKEVSVKV